MKARLHARSLVAAVAVAAGAGTASAQSMPQRTPPHPDTPRMMVQVFGSADRKMGPEASDELRERLIRAFPSRILWVIDRKDIIAVLEQSGYDTLSRLQPSDESQLAKAQRADEYVTGHVTRQGDMYTVQAWLVLTRDNSLTQPLPAATGNRPDRAVGALVKSIQDARKQLDEEKKCMSFARDNKLTEAIAAADLAVTEYPQATLARYCKLNVLIRQNASDSAKLVVANEILAVDSLSKNALAIAADAYAKLGNQKASNDMLLRLLAANPGDAEMVKKVIEALAGAGDLERAKEYVVKAVADNPGDIGLVGLQYKILTAMKEYKAAIRTGEEMVQMDTSLATVDFFTRQVALFAADSQPQKAAETAARATQKFANDADLWQLYAATLKAAGQLQQSIGAAKRALEINPKIANGWTQIAVAYDQLNMPDSALVALRQAKAAGDNAEQVGNYALTIGNRLYKAATAEEPKKAESFALAQPYLYFADSTTTNVQARTNAKLLIGVTHFYIGQIVAQGLQASKSCEDAKRGQASVVESMIYVPQGARDNPQLAGQLMQGLNSLQPYYENAVKGLCK
ncbi:MAG: hypothetical protein K1X31_13050 [Gemmatimonadaceae bacterium]|nr:hypothetical protein [Gemmatimonadaceae bacterium]